MLVNDLHRTTSNERDRDGESEEGGYMACQCTFLEPGLGKEQDLILESNPPVAPRYKTTSLKEGYLFLVCRNTSSNINQDSDVQVKEGGCQFILQQNVQSTDICFCYGFPIIVTYHAWGLSHKLLLKKLILSFNQTWQLSNERTCVHHTV